MCFSARRVCNSIGGNKLCVHSPVRMHARSYRFRGGIADKYSLKYQIKVCFFLILKIMINSLAKIQRKNQWSIINKFIYKKHVTKFQHQKTKNQTVILIFPKNIALTFWYVVLYTWKYDGTVKISLSTS